LNRLIVTQGNGPRTIGVIDQEHNATAALTDPREQLAVPDAQARGGAATSGLLERGWGPTPSGQATAIGARLDKTGSMPMRPRRSIGPERAPGTPPVP